MIKYKASILGKPADNGVLKNAKTAVPLKYLRNFWWSLGIPLITCKIYLEMNWTKTKNCVMFDNDDDNDENTTFNRGYFRNWGQHPEDTKKGTFSQQKG